MSGPLSVSFAAHLVINLANLMSVLQVTVKFQFSIQTTLRTLVDEGVAVKYE